MTQKQDGEFYRGESWIVRGTINDEFGEAKDLTGATVKLRFTTGTTVVKELVTPTDGAITSIPGGTYQFLINEAGQTLFTAKAYAFELKAFFADGSSSVQNNGVITILPSKFNL